MVKYKRLSSFSFPFLALGGAACTWALEEQLDMFSQTYYLLDTLLAT